MEKVLEVSDEEITSSFEDEDDFEDIPDESDSADDFLRSLFEENKETPFEKGTSN